MSCYSLPIKVMLCEGVTLKTKVRNSVKVVLPDVFKLQHIGKLKQLGPLNAGEKFINSKKKKNVIMITKLPN